jgi:hypothetical protein
MGREVVTAKDCQVESIATGMHSASRTTINENSFTDATGSRAGGRDALTANELEPAPAPPAAAPAVPTRDDYLSKLYKYIPAEVIALYISIDGFLRTLPPMQKQLMQWAMVVVGVVATIAFLSRIQKVQKSRQLLISAGAFLVWAFALGGPFENLLWYHGAYGSVALLLYTFFVPIADA